MFVAIEVRKIYVKALKRKEGFQSSCNHNVVEILSWPDWDVVVLMPKEMR